MGNRIGKQEDDQGVQYGTVFIIFLGICFCIILIWRIRKGFSAEITRARSYPGRSRRVRGDPDQDQLTNLGQFLGVIYRSLGSSVR